MPDSKQGVFALFKGDSGAGKTVGAGSFPDPIVLDHDKKMPAILRKHFPHKNIPFQQYNDALQFGDLIERWSKEGCPFETVIVDSITSLSYAVIKTLDDLKGQNILTTMRNIKGTKSGAGKTIELRGFDYYNAEDSFLKFYLDGLKMLWADPGKKPYNVIVIAHVMTSEQSDIRTKEVVKTRRIVTAGSKIAAYIPAQFDEAWHFGISHGDLLGGEDSAKVKHFVSTEAIGDDFAKTAYRLPNKIDFTNGSLYDQIRPYIDLNEPQREIESNAANNKVKLNF